MIDKISIGLAQSKKSYGLNKNNKIQEVLKELNNQDITSLDTSLSYNGSYNYLKVINLNEYNLSIKFPKISNRKNLKKKVKELIEEIFIKYNIKKFDTLLLHDPLLPLEKDWKIVEKILIDYKLKKKIKNIGVSVYSKYELENILKVFNPDVVQFPLNIFFQSFDEAYLKKLKKLKIKLHARSIFLQGLLTMQKSKIPIFFDIWKDHLNRYHEIINDNKFDLIDFNLNFILSKKILDKVIIGFSDSKQFLQVLNKIKRFKINKRYTEFYKELAINDKLINDPRFWPSNKDIVSFKTYKKWINNKKIINGGVGLLSKRPDLYLPVGWPTYYSKAQGCFIWSEDGKKYLDFSLMGVGTNILGYADKDVNKVSINKIKSSNSSTLISSDEVNLAKELISAHPWSGKTVFARTGGEANAVALRIARLSNKKKEVAVCGYHGWHDWYLAANIKKDNLKEIHLEGLNPDGVPSVLGNYVHPFKFNDLKAFKNLLKKNINIGIVFMEVERNLKLNINFLKEIRQICTKKKIILIFDECSSGFREVYGGLHMKYKVYPDLAVFGKSIANGIPLTVVLGKKEVMDNAENSFISSTFWSDTLAPAAGLATLNKMKKIKSWKKISNTGRKIKKAWKLLSKKHDLKIEIKGIDPMPTFDFVSRKNLYYKNFVTQEFLKKGILASNTIYCCIYHAKYLKTYLKTLDKIFLKISEFEKNLSISDFLKYPISSVGFDRLN